MVEKGGKGGATLPPQPAQMHMLDKNPSSGLQVQKIEIKSYLSPPDHHSGNNAAPAVILKPPPGCSVHWRQDLTPGRGTEEET